jgi:TolB-like protein/cytochrome c-type biogenesis protein CcmH/NrfG
MSAPTPPLIRFGSVQLDTRSGDLFRQGVKVHLQGQPFQALMLLIERRGEVVTREELQTRLWPGSTFVDFDRGLNKAINKLRVALGDDAEKPRYIETLTQRGYRLVAPIEFSQALDDLRPQQMMRIDSLAVLPLDNLSGDPAQEYFSDGMTDELICEIAKIGSLRVISRTSVMRYKGSGKSLPEIAQELRVDAVLEGSVVRSGERVRITAQLIHALNDCHLWSGRYEQDMRDILQLQAEVAQSIATQIQKIVGPANVSSAAPRQVHPPAYEAYLKGNFFRDKLNPIDLEKSIAFFTQAIDLDPAYAPAYGALARSYQFVAIFGMRHPVEVFLKVRANAIKALELDKTSAAAHIALASVNVFDSWDWAAAEAECRRAVELNPGLSFTHGHLADYLSIRGKHTEAITEFRRALELDPISPEYNNWLALMLYRARRYDESIAHCQKVLEIDPHHVNVLWFLALSLEQKGELGDAIASLEKAVRLSGGPHYQALLGRAYALAGQKTRALAILDELKAFSQQRYVSPFDMAVIHFGLGDQAPMFEYLEEAYRQRVWRIIELTMPFFDSLRSDPRWHDLVLRIGLAQ